MPSPRHSRVTFDTPDFAVIEADRARYKNAALATRTISSYASDVRVFEAWATAGARTAFPASEETVELYICDLLKRGRKVTTVARHCCAIRRDHVTKGLPDPCGAEVRRVLSGARRILCQLVDQKEALELRDLRKIVRKIGSRTPIRARNSALLVFGFSTALRRSTLAALSLDDVTFTRDGLIVTIRNEKQDRKGNGRRVAVPFGVSSLCPVTVLGRWLKLRGNTPGALFCHVMRGVITPKRLHGNRIGQIVQESVALVGLNPRRFGAHSMRAGFASEALARGVNELAVARVTGHASLDTLRLYDRSRNLFRGNASGLVGL